MENKRIAAKRHKNRKRTDILASFAPFRGQFASQFVAQVTDLSVCPQDRVERLPTAGLRRARRHLSISRPQERPEQSVPIGRRGVPAPLSSAHPATRFSTRAQLW